MKIGLVNPANELVEKQMPLGLGYLASYILSKNNDVIVQVLDTAIASKKEVAYFISERYDLVGVSVTSFTYRDALKLIKLFKENDPNVLIVLGGPHVSLMMEQVMQEPLIDIAVYGEGEITFDEIIKSIKKDPNRLNTEHLQTIKGLIYRKNGEIIVNPPRDLIKDLDTLPFPAFHLFPMKRYPGKYPLITSRGCPFSCVFCASSKIWGRRWRARSPKNIIAEVKYIIKHFGVRPIDFHDDSFNINLDRVNALCDEFINNKIKIPWGVRGIRADKLNFDIAKKMRKAGCSHVAIGIESANPDMLKRMGKRETIEQIQHGIQTLQSAHIDVLGQFMIGNPGETLDTVKESIKFVKENNIEAEFGTIVPFPRTQLWDYVQKNGRFLVEPDCTLFERVQPRIIFDTPEFRKEQVLKAMRLVEEAGIRLWKQPGQDRRDRSTRQVWFKYVHGILPPSVSYYTYFLLRRILESMRRYKMNLRN